MGGENPYIKGPKPSGPKQKYTITYLPEGKTVEVDPANVPSGGTGLPGSVLDIALGCDIDIDHACGGVAACSTCHVVVKEGFDTLSESTEEEEDQLDKAPGVTTKSRLACQAVANGSKNLVVEVPNWNRNLAREKH